MSKWLVFTLEEENTLKMSEFARNRNAERSVASLFWGSDATKALKDASASYVLALPFGNTIAFLSFLRLKLLRLSQGPQTSSYLGSYQRGSSGLEDAKGAIVFLGHLEKDLQPHQLSPLEKFRRSADHDCEKCL